MKKAKREIEECKNFWKKPKHRGLLRTKPDMKKAEEHVTKAEHDLRATEYLVKGGFSDVSIGTIFYAMYQCFLAISSKFGYESSNQTCTIALIEYLAEEGKIDLDEKYVQYFKYKDEEERDSVIEMREGYTYGTETKADKSKIDLFIMECRELIEITRGIIFSSDNMPN